MITTAQLATELGLTQRRVQQIVSELGLEPERVGQAFVLTEEQAARVRRHSKRRPTATATNNNDR